MNPTKLTKYIGAMTGTSADGFDIVAIDFSEKPPYEIWHKFMPFEEPLKDEIMSLYRPGHDDIHRMAITSNKITKICASAITDFLKTLGWSANDVAAIGSHGQTIRHRPQDDYSIQIQNGALLAHLTSIDVVCDFRSRDIAAGGEGAPLAPLFHHHLFSGETGCAVVNIGGISNVTLLPAQKKNTNPSIIGFDCGPGNSLMDAWNKKHKNTAFDQNGFWAAQGTVIKPLLQELLEMPFIKRPAPKSADREEFSLNAVKGFLKTNFAPQDVQATFLEFTAKSIIDSIEATKVQLDKVIICGGGAENQQLVGHIKNMLPNHEVCTTNDLGYPAKWIEAAAFAFFAFLRIHEKPLLTPTITGATINAIAGALYRK